MASLAEVLAQMKAGGNAPALPKVAQAVSAVPAPAARSSLADMLAQMKAGSNKTVIAPVVPMAQQEAVPTLADRVLGVLTALPPSLAKYEKAFRDYLSSPDTFRAIGNHAAQFNDLQLAAVSAIALGFTLNIIGSAGVGKTTAVRVGASERYRMVTLQAIADGHTPTTKVVGCAFTRQATGVLRSKMDQPVKQWVTTIHKLLGFQPTYVEKIDPATGETRITRPFLPSFNAENKLPQDIRTIIIDEVSMLGGQLEHFLLEACSEVSPPQIVRVGDFGQLEPVQDRSSLMFALASDIPTIELTQIYRTEKGPVLDIAYAARNGNAVALQDTELRKLSNEFPDEFCYLLNLVNGEPCKTLHGALARVLGYITNAMEKGDIDIYRGDMILCPHNDNFGVKPINRAIAEFYDKRDKRMVWPVRAGYEMHYLAVGDRIRVNNESVFISKIVKNYDYSGKEPPEASRDIDRMGEWLAGSALAGTDGAADSEAGSVMEFFSMGEDSADTGSASAVSLEEIQAQAIAAFKAEEEKEKENRRQVASHRVYYRYPDQLGMDAETPSLQSQYIDTAAEFNEEKAGLLNYASTVHKAQGSEGQHVLIALHRSHASTLRRETIYTAITRARKKVTILTDPGLLAGAAMKTSFPGATWASKAANYVAKCEGLDKVAAKAASAQIGKAIAREAASLTGMRGFKIG